MQRIFFVKELKITGVCNEEKRCDITIWKVSNDGGCEEYQIFDVKKTVRIKRTAFKLCAQWTCGCNYLFSKFEDSRNEIELAKGTIGVCTREWNQNLLEKEVQNLIQEYEIDYEEDVDKMPWIIRSKKMSDLLRKKNNIQLLKDFVDGKFYYATTAGEQIEYTIRKIILEPDGNIYKTKIVFR